MLTVTLTRSRTKASLGQKPPNKSPPWIFIKQKLSRIYSAIIPKKQNKQLKPCKYLEGCSTWINAIMAHNYAAPLKQEQ